jgi:hypothetical protein
MTDSPYRDDDELDLEGAALGALSHDEMARVMARVDASPALQAELAALREAAASLPGALPAGDSGLRDATRARLLARAAADASAHRAAATPGSPLLVMERGAAPATAPRVGVPTPWFVAMALALAASLVLLFRTQGTLERAQRAFAVADRERVRSTDSLMALVGERDLILAQLTGPQVRVVEMATVDARKPYARMFWDKATDRWTLVAHNLPPVADDRIYQLWLVAGGKKISAGTFVPNRHGDAVVRATYALDEHALQAVAVTEEPAAGVPQPTGPMVVVGKVGQ